MKKLLSFILTFNINLLIASNCIVINEIHYNPDIDQGQEDADYEFVELFNRCEDTVDVSGWSLYKHDNCWGCHYDEIYTFEHGYEILPHEYVVLSHNSHYYPGSLDWGEEYLPNYGSELILVDQTCHGYNIKDYVNYDDVTPWAHTPDGHGPSLELKNPGFNNEDPHSWQASYIFGGTPGYQNSNHEHEEFCDELNYWECLESTNCEWHSFGWWSGDCVNSENEDTDESDENEDETDEEENAQVAYLSFGNFENGVVEVMVDSNTPLAGFQFALEGLSLEGVFGGLAEENNFTVEYSSETNIVIGFSLQGNIINSGSYILTNLNLSDMSGSGCIVDAILSNSNGEAIDVIYGDCLDFDENIYGCMDESACNYMNEATFDNGSCEYPQENFDCDGNCLVATDCLGVCGGTAELDECGVCDGSGPEENFDCEGNCLIELDCSGTCGGTAQLDECGVCLGSGITEGACDCEGNVFDCDGVCGGTAELDECGVCEGDGIADGACDCEGNIFDCAGVCGGSAELDECGVCDGPGPEENFDCEGNCLVETDCLGTCGGTAELDECGECNGEGIAEGACDCDGNVFDCENICGGDAVVDECGECNGSGANFLCEDGAFACNENDCNNFDGCDLPADNLYLSGNDLFYNSSNDIGGFQFEVVGANILDVFGGTASDAGFTISSSSSIVLGFSFEGNVISAGCGTLLTFELDGDATGISEIIISDNVGNSIDFTYFAGDENCPSGIYDCNDVCDGSAITDDCGVCEGLNACLGCTDTDALNYNQGATVDDGSCEYFDYSNMVVINEIHYNPALSLQGADSDYEFLELYNNSSEEINLSGWSLESTNINFTFTSEYIFMPNTHLLLARSGSVYEEYLPWGDERLENGTDAIYLYDNVNQLVDYVEYSDSTPWPELADAGGSSLELLDPSFDNAEATNWQSSLYVGGTPSEQNFIPIYGCTDVNACNYISNANVDDNSCEYPEENFNCLGECLVEVDCQGECGGQAILDDCGVCDGSGEDCIEGCSDSLATNFNSSATLDDGSCFYAGPNYPLWDQNFDSIFDNFNDYEFSMSITSLVYIEGTSVLGENDMLAAFVGDELRGVSQSLLVPTALGHELSFQLLIYSNQETDEELTFKYYSFIDDTTYSLNESFVFNADTFVGDVNSPVLFSYGSISEYYPVDLENTGNSALFIFTEEVGLHFGDEVGIFDPNGITTSSLDCELSVGETLVGSGVWQQQQMEIVAIESVNLCDLGGFLLGGYQVDSEIIIKVFSNVDQTEYYAIPSYTIGESTWGQPIYVINNLELVPEAEFFIQLDPLSLNLISVNLASDDSHLDSMFGDDVLLIFDDNSNFYIPNYDVNQIGDYNYAEGYMVFSMADEEVAMNMTGQLINHDHPVLLEPFKANMIPYFHQECLPVDYAFSSITDNLLLVKNDNGQYYIPQSDINTLNVVCPGNAYIVFTNNENPITFQYPQMIMGRNYTDYEMEYDKEQDLYSMHNIQKTGLSTPIIIDYIDGNYNIGDHLVVYADNKKVGCTEITGEFPVVISAWESFNYDAVNLEGYDTGDKINFKLFDNNKSQYIPLGTNLDSEFFSNQLLIRGSVTIDQQIFGPANFSISSIYPNPFNPITTISFEIFRPGNYLIEIYNLKGQKLYYSNTYYAANGIYSQSWDAKEFASGIYIAKMSSGNQTIVKKLTLMK